MERPQRHVPQVCAYLFDPERSTWRLRALIALDPPEAIDALAADGARMVITVDCGVTAVEEADRARDLGYMELFEKTGSGTYEGRFCVKYMLWMGPQTR